MKNRLGLAAAFAGALACATPSAGCGEQKTDKNDKTAVERLLSENARLRKEMEDYRFKEKVDSVRKKSKKEILDLLIKCWKAKGAPKCASSSSIDKHGSSEYIELKVKMQANKDAIPVPPTLSSNPNAPRQIQGGDPFEGLGIPPRPSPMSPQQRKQAKEAIRKQEGERLKALDSLFQRSMQP